MQKWTNAAGIFSLVTILLIVGIIYSIISVNLFLLILSTALLAPVFFFAGLNAKNNVIKAILIIIALIIALISIMLFVASTVVVCDPVHNPGGGGPVICDPVHQP